MRMKNFLYTLGVSLCFLITSPSMAEELSVQQLVSQAEIAIARGNPEDIDDLFDKIYVRTTGLAPSVKGWPEHLSDVEYQNKLCPYRKAVAPLYLPEDIEYFHHKMRLTAIGIIQAKEENALFIQAIIGCTLENGEPVPEAKALKDGLSWVKKLKTANDDEVQVVVKAYKKLAKQNPQNLVYMALAGIADFPILDRKIERLLQKAKKMRTEGLLYQAKLVEKADKGNLDAQLKVAHRLETGDKFRQDNAAAYFWYKRAQQNGGGEAAQSGIKRLLPQLEDTDFISIEIWTKNNLRPY